jgi:hypothetical protein
MCFCCGSLRLPPKVSSRTRQSSICDAVVVRFDDSPIAVVAELNEPLAGDRGAELSRCPIGG